MKSILWGIFTGALVFSDLKCKSYVENNYEKIQKKEICLGKVEVRRVHNKGMMLNKGEKYPETVRLASMLACMIAGIQAIVEWERGRSALKKLGVALTFAGAISNTYDRLRRKYVVDYFAFKSKDPSINRVTFNLADMFIFIGSILLIVATLFGCGTKKRRR